MWIKICFRISLDFFQLHHCVAGNSLLLWASTGAKIPNNYALALWSFITPEAVISCCCLTLVMRIFAKYAKCAQNYLIMPGITLEQQFGLRGGTSTLDICCALRTFRIFFVIVWDV